MGSLGSSLVKAFLREGASVAIPHSPRADWASFYAALDSPENVVGAACDVTNEEAVARFGALVDQRLGRIDIVVHAVGGWKPGGIGETDLAAFRAMLDLNLASAFVVTRMALPQMKARGDGRIVFIGAMAAQQPVAGSLAYSVAKAGVVALARAVADGVRGSGVTANAILPGTILTEANRAWGKPAQMATWVTPAELCAAILFLASAEASGVNGAVIPAAGRE
jgi:NAD(P)-dependent dehydrogenase (short-subunit alcohol dehydrogenase family)